MPSVLFGYVPRQNHRWNITKMFQLQLPNCKYSVAWREEAIMSKVYGLCPKCIKYKYLTRHHVLPQRFYKKIKQTPILYICRDCHDKLERKIPVYPRLRSERYLEIAQDFLV